MNAGIPVIADPKVTRHILSAFRLRASKRLGQNFLVDRGVVQGIVDAAELSPADTVLEIGPGIGTLTQGLAETGARVIAVEIDKKLPRVLAETLKGYDNVTIVPGDILKLNIPEILGLKEGERFKVAANLPYYITTPTSMRKFCPSRLLARRRNAFRMWRVTFGSAITGRLAFMINPPTQIQIPRA